MNPETIKAMQTYMHEETIKYNLVNAYDKLIKEKPMKAFHELGIVRVVTPGFIKYFNNYTWKKTTFNDWDKLYTIEDEKFKYLNKDYKCVEMMREVYRLANDENFMRYVILKHVGIDIKCEIPNNIMKSIYQIRSRNVGFEMNHEKMSEPYDIGNIHVIKDNGKYTVINGNHRVLGYMYYSINVNMDYKPIQVWIGEKNEL